MGSQPTKLSYQAGHGQPPPDTGKNDHEAPFRPFLPVSPVPGTTPPGLTHHRETGQNSPRNARQNNYKKRLTPGCKRAIDYILQL